ncbi:MULTISPECIES: hypothetical protein [Ectopseudomonas]|jgi:hypothetical protein|uniref:hypothetical protein n=1 Tax=Ectopseudomonas TaxID=3236654 RepID=UPI000AF6C19E|nr:MULTISPECIES: hypothetical protein [Pseudomonas]MBP3062110.1 hypothetical protein [Pseudomonas chengduensis]NNB75402.1 hypothetical protein [Pseudomonas chengduensis]
MSESVKPPMDNEKSGSLTTDDLRSMVLDHVIEQMNLFVPKTIPEPVGHMTELLDSMNQLALKIAAAALVNRQNLSPLKTFDSEIGIDPDQDQTGNRYELRYRLVEQIGKSEPHVDQTFTYDEAVAAYDQSFVDTYWGALGERCPKCVTAPGDRHLWFTVVRYPIADLDMEQSANHSSRRPTHGPRQ